MHDQMLYHTSLGVSLFQVDTSPETGSLEACYTPITRQSLLSLDTQEIYERLSCPGARAWSASLRLSLSLNRVQLALHLCTLKFLNYSL